jgi:hypothetical protein
MRSLILALFLVAPIATTASAKNLYIPAAGVSPGTNGTFWRTDVRMTIRPEFRTNAGVMNPPQETAIVKLKLVGIDGNPLLESAVLEVPPQSMRQWSTGELFGGVYMADGVILMESTAPVFTWGSIVDNQSGDAIFVRGVDEMDIAPALND